MSINKRHYLDKIGLERFQDNMKNDKRNKKWKKQHKKYGFDERDTWNLDSTMAEILYERLKMFNEVNLIDTHYHTIEIDGVKMSMQEAIDELLKSLKLKLTDGNLEVAYSNEVRAWTIWLKLIEKGIMWW